MRGNDHITIYATVPWEATLLSTNAVSNFPSTGNATTTSVGTPGGEELIFKMQNGRIDDNNATHHAQTMIRFTSPTGAFAPVDIPVDGYWGYPFAHYRDNEWNYRVLYFWEHNSEKNKSNSENDCNDTSPGSWYLGSENDYKGLNDAIAHSYHYRQKMGIKEDQAYMTTYTGFSPLRRKVNLTTRESIGGTTLITG